MKNRWSFIILKAKAVHIRNNFPCEIHTLSIRIFRQKFKNNARDKFHQDFVYLSYRTACRSTFLTIDTIFAILLNFYFAL